MRTELSTTAATSERMSRQGRRDTSPELKIRRELHRLGLRYRLDKRPADSLRTRADIVFGPARIAVFVDGCFWHGCPEHATQPRNNATWWRTKIDANRNRDRRNTAALEEVGWHVVRVWEHDDAVEAARRIEELVRRRRQRDLASSADEEGR